MHVGQVSGHVTTCHFDSYDGNGNPPTPVGAKAASLLAFGEKASFS